MASYDDILENIESKYKYSNYFKIMNVLLIPFLIFLDYLVNIFIPLDNPRLEEYVTYTLFFLWILTNILYGAYCGMKHRILPDLIGRNRVIDYGEDTYKLGLFLLILGIIFIIGFLIFTISFF